MQPQWCAGIQPNGKEYFYRNSGLPAIMKARHVWSQDRHIVCAWATEVERQAKNQGLVFDKNMD